MKAPEYLIHMQESIDESISKNDVIFCFFINCRRKWILATVKSASKIKALAI
jgi:hypothetical protein